MNLEVIFRHGTKEEYEQLSRIVPGILYFIIDEESKGHLYLNGIEYGFTEDGSQPPIPTADEILTTEAITVTKDVGNYSAGTVIPSGTNVQNLLKDMLMQDIYPIAHSPEVTLSSSGWSAITYEVGIQLNIGYTCSLSQGSYSVEGQPSQSGGVTATSYSIIPNVVNISGLSSGSSASGSLGTATFQDNATLSITATVIGSEGNMPKTFLNADYPAAQIPSQTYMKSYGTARSARKYFVGYTDNLDRDYSNNLIPGIIRSGTGSFTPITSFPTTHMQQMFFAAPQSVGITSVQVYNSVTSLPQTVQKYPTTLNVPGDGGRYPISYDVWYIKNAAPESGSSTFTVMWS